MYPMKAVCGLPGQRAAVGGLDKTVRPQGMLDGPSGLGTIISPKKTVEIL